MIKYPLFALLISLSLFVWSPDVNARETIKNYRVNIAVDINGGLNIHEKIEVLAEGVDIKRGIYRDFIVSERGFLGKRINTDYNIISVQRDGVDEPHHTEMMGNMMRLYIGQSSQYLKTNQIYIYDIQYYVPDQIDYYNDFDELYWNAIGTQWAFPIEQANIFVVFPELAQISQYSTYTGKNGETGGNYIARKSENTLTINNKHALPSYEGITFAAAIQKNIINRPSQGFFFSNFFKEHPGLLIVCLGLLSTLYLIYVFWKQVGKDPKSRGRAPFYTPPKNISAAEATFIKSMGKGGASKILSVAILSIASKGWFKIKQNKDKNYEIINNTEDRKKADLSEDELLVYKRLKDGHLMKRHDSLMIKLARDHHKFMKKKNKGKFFKYNSKYWGLSLLPILATIAITPLIVNLVPEGTTIFFYIMAFIAFIFSIIFSLILFQLMTESKYTITKVISVLIFTIILALLSVLIGEIFIYLNTSYFVIFLGLMMIFSGAYAQPLLETFTKNGREILDHLHGLEYYMEAVEEKILKKFDPPEMSHELYEELFPYAAALDIESKWGDKFLATMTTATAAGVVANTTHTHTNPDWYISDKNGSVGEGFNISNFVSDFSRNISAAITTKSSSSSGGSSGSSGGGGGGGGGGGW